MKRNEQLSFTLRFKRMHAARKNGGLFSEQQQQRLLIPGHLFSERVPVQAA